MRRIRRVVGFLLYRLWPAVLSERLWLAREKDSAVASWKVEVLTICGYGAGSRDGKLVISTLDFL